MKKIGLLCCAFAWLTILTGVGVTCPAFPEWFDLQVDGKSRSVQLRGDEYRNWYEDEEGNVIRYNSRNRTGTNTGMKRADIRRLNQVTTRVKGISPWTPRRLSGNRNLLVVLVSFSDRSARTAVSDWQEMFFASDFSVASYYAEQSGGAVRVVPAGGEEGVVHVHMTTNHPNTGTDQPPSLTEAQQVTACLSEVLKAGVTGEVFDKDGNGVLTSDELVVGFVYAGYEASASRGALSPSTWAHAQGYTLGENSPSFGGVKLGQWFVMGEEIAPSMGTPLGIGVHEIGHAMFELPDLYDESAESDPVGQFSVMGTGNWGAKTGEIPGSRPVGLDAWSLRYNGWGVVTDVDSPEDSARTLAAGREILRVLSPSHRSTEYFLAQVRSLSDKWDAGLEALPRIGNAGLLILHADDASGSGNWLRGNNFNLFGGKGLRVVPADDGSNAFSRDVVAFTRENLWRQDNPNTKGDGSFLPDGTPAARFHDGSPSDLGITGISKGADHMTVAVSNHGIDIPFPTIVLPTITLPTIPPLFPTTPPIPTVHIETPNVSVGGCNVTGGEMFVTVVMLAAGLGVALRKKR